MTTRRILALFLVLATLGSGCYSKTKLYSKPSGATVVIDRKGILGTTPLELEEQVWLWTDHQLTFTAPGYAPQSIQIRNTGINWAYAVVCACTLGLLLPIGLASTYPQQFVVELVPNAPAAPATALVESKPLAFR